MKYSRGRIIALTILSVTMVLSLFGSTCLFNYRNFNSNAVNNEAFMRDPNYIPTFDDLYERMGYDSADTGTITLGQSTTLTLLEERYDRGVLTEFLNAMPANTRSFPEFQTKRKAGYPYPIYTNTEMRSIVNGLGNNLEVPVIMLDPYNYDDIVLFELTNLSDIPKDLTITRDGQTLANLIYEVDSKYPADQVYCGVPNNLSVGGETVETVIDDADGNEIFNLTLTPNAQNVNGYTAVIENADGTDLNIMDTSTGSISLKVAPNITLSTDSTIRLCNSNAKILYRVVRSGNSIKVYDARNDTPENEQVLLGEINYTNSALTTFDIGAVAYNGNALRAMFQEQGFYQIMFKQKITSGDGVFTQLDISFSFVIVNKANYMNFPRFDTKYRVAGNSEIYNYSYESEYPTLTYMSYFFDVQVQTTAKYSQNNPDDFSRRELQFYNIGEYHVISTLRYYSWYLFDLETNQGIKTPGAAKGYVTLKHYTQYSSILNILGFQAYYGGQHSDSKYNGPLPFYDSENANISSDISAWVREAKMTAKESGSVTDYNNMRVSDALTYATELANYVTTKNLQPVRTNFPPVKLYSNVGHATGAGMNGEAAVVLSSVAYKASSGTGNTAEWVSSTMEVGAPFEAAGQYLLTVYFKVNGEMCQQTFFFEIVNAVKIAFDVTANGSTKTYNVGDLVLNQTLSGQTVKLNYDGQRTLGQFEVPPTITLAYAEFSNYTYTDMNFPVGNGGAFEFVLRPGQYRLTIKYGAHSKSTSVFNIVVDDTSATGIKAHTTADSLDNLPENVAIVGAGEVSLTWKQKDSGINFNNVLCEFYEMELEKAGTDPNADRNYQYFKTPSTNLYAAYAFSKTVSKPDDGYQPIKTEDGWTLKETFAASGLYRFTLIDDVGNETYFVLIIDGSTPTFVQSVESELVDTNAVIFDANEGVKLGFGTKKLIANQSQNKAMFGGTGFVDIFENLMNPDVGVLVPDKRGINNKGNEQPAIGVGLSKIEYSVGGETYRDVADPESDFSQVDVDNGYVVLKEEGTYYFRVTDDLGNVGEYYIILTHDNCLGMVYAESSYLSISTEDKYLDRGMVAETSPTVYTSLVTSTGGMTNRPYVTFSFLQRPIKDDFRVDCVYLQYYPFTYDLNSKNYPFAEKPVNNPLTENNEPIFPNQSNSGLIYQYHDILDAQGGTIRLALFNVNTITPSGMYIISRRYTTAPKDGGLDTIARDYYFIVDDQKMLHYDVDKYQTELKVTFAKSDDYYNKEQYPKVKVADAKVFHDNNNELSSNRVAYVSGFNNKYSWKHKTTNYKIENYNFVADISNDPRATEHNFNFPSLTPRFSYINSNNQIKTMGEGSGTWMLGAADTRADGPVYRLVVADNARSISCLLIDGNLVELKTDASAPTSANYDYLVLNLDTAYGTKAEIIVEDNKTISNSHMEFDGNAYVYIVDPSEINQLKFRFENDQNSMYAGLDIDATVASWKANGFTRDATFATPNPVDNQYTFDLMEDFLNGMVIPNGASLSVSLLTYDDTCTNYTILFDISKPNYNLAKVKDGDNLARTLNASELPGGYVYGLSDSFVFASDQDNNRYLDVKTITYREVDSTGEGSQPAVQFKLYTGAEGEEPIPFATLVGLRDNEMKYYYITETDYAGHINSYLVQIQGSNYVNAINFIGATSNEGDKIQTGIEMHASSSSVHQFFLRNNSFKFVSGDEYYTVLGSTASWHIGNDTGTGPKSEENLIKALNNWINVATEKGVSCSYTLYDRIGAPEIFEFYNIRENAANLRLDCYQASETSSIIMVTAINYDDLPLILFDEKLSALFKMKIEDRTAAGTNMDTYFSLKAGTPIQGFDVSHELVITVTDPFGRVSTTEYHQQSQRTINFNVYGNTITQNGVIYIGDERGVEFSYLSTVYKVLIYDAATDELLSDLQSFISNNMISHTFTPKKGSTTLQQYHIVATGRASGAILFDQTFVFDTRLPNVEWKNASDQTIEVEDQTFVSAVIFDISKNLVPTAFPVTVSYVRTLDGQTERVTLRPDTKKFTFDQVGAYEVTLRNAVWAKKTYKFEIVQIDNTMVLVYDDGEQIQASTSDYKFYPDRNNTNEYTYIPRYVFTTMESSNGIFYPLFNYQAHGLEIRVGQTNRVLAGNTELGTDYYYYDEPNKTLVWRLAFLSGQKNGEPIYTSPIYFATTGVSSGELNSGTAITLRLNGNPSSSGSASLTPFPVVPNTTTYHIIRDSFMTAHDNKLEVSLYCDMSVLRDAFGAPCYLVEGNLILVDCYYNGKLVKTLNYGDVFTINRYDAGYYEFTVHDLVGNYLYFGNSSDESDILYRQKRYMLAVMTKPMILINDKQPVNGMVYNDQVEMKLVDYGNTFLTKLYADKLKEDKEFFNKQFCVTKMEVRYTGSNGETMEEYQVNGSQTSFYWNRSGNYRVKVSYSIGSNISDLLESEYQFQIVPSYTIRESFSMPIYPDIKVESVKRNGYKIHDFDDLKVNDYMKFSADENPGSYTITLQTYNAILQTYITHVVEFNIQHKANSASSYFVLSSGSGTATTGTVTLYYNPYWLYHAQGTVMIYLYKDFVEQQAVTVDSSTLATAGVDSQALFSVSDAGLYTVMVRDADGDYVHMDTWTVNAQQSTFGYVILAVVLGVVGIGILVFMRMRRKMTTK